MKLTVLLLAITALSFGARDASATTLYRVGAPLSSAEKDSLESIGIDYREIEWSTSQVLDSIHGDSLEVGSLQPNFFAEDEDLAATLLDRNGFVAGVDLRWRMADRARAMIDHDPTTAYIWAAVPPEAFVTLANNRWSAYFDLGERFRVREIRFRPVEGRPDNFLEHFRIGVSEEGMTRFNVPGFQTITEVKGNTEPEVSVVLDPPLTVRSIWMRIFRHTAKQISVGAFEVYGGGFISQAAYESDVIDLEDIGSWGEIRWSGRKDPHARIAIRTRAGTDPQPDVFWETRPEQQDSVRFLGGGGDLSLTEYKREYAKLKEFLKPIEKEDWVTYDTEHWSFWSSPYAFENPGVAIASPGPRQFIQIKADFSSTVEEAGKIDYIEFKASSPPLVRELQGEIYPIEVEVGEVTHFTYYIKPSIRSEDHGFDAVEISTPSGVVSVDSLRLDETDQEDFSWNIREDGLGFEVFLPRRLEPSDSGTLVEVVFNALVLREVGTLFEGRAFNTSRPHEVRQRILPGDAAVEVESERLSVTTSLSSSLVFSPQVSPNPFTPNDDGVNDVVNISYKLLRVTSSVPVSIEIFDLSGRLMKQVYMGDDPLGEYSHNWDGTDNSNSLVPPGLYLYRISADLQSELETNSGIFSVAY